jgi:hypothetical protein
VRESAYVWLLTRALFLALTYFGVILFAPATGTLIGTHLHDAAHPSFLHRLLPAWNQWDTMWYVDIARRGYDWQKSVGTSPTAFFPLYPMSIRIAVEATHRSYLTSALLVSNLAFFAALIYLWKLASRDVGDGAAGRSLLYVAVFPTALFFFGGYTESVFLLVSVASFYHMRRQEWLLAGGFAALASATRVTGALLLVPMLYEYGRSRNFSVRRIDRGALGLLFAPLGLLAFMLYLQASVGNALAFTSSQEAWQKIFTPWIWSGFAESLRQIVEVQPSASFFEAHNVINAGIGGLFLTWSFLAARKLPPPYGLYLLAFWIATLTSPAMAHGYPVPLISLSRYVVTLFPVFLYMGTLGRHERFHSGYLTVSAGLLAVFTVQFVTGGWII